MEEITKEYIPEQLYCSTVMLYGAGTTGRRIINLLKPYQICIKYIIDDDMNRWGTEIEGIKVISHQKLKELCENCKNVSIILTTIYGKTVLNRLNKISGIKIYEMYRWLDEVYDSDNLAKHIHKEEIEQFRQRSNLLKNKLADQESIDVLDGLYAYLHTQDLNYISNICTTYDQYFIPEVITAIHEPLELVDGGAYVGELYQVIKQNNIKLGHWFCFEADESNYNLLLNLSKKANLSEKQVCIKKGLWDKEEVLYFEGEKDTSSKIVDYTTNFQIETISLDTFFKNRKCNFIKMDIEGAEYPALRGGIKIIKRDRPILAISIYHSLDDYFKIPNYLMQQLVHYKYYIRQHALILSETVLYAIPEE